MAKTLDKSISELCTEQQLRGEVIQGANIQRAYNEWSKAGNPCELPTNAHLERVFQSGIEYALNLLSGKMGVSEYQWGDGSESVDGDVEITIDNIFREAGLADENGDVYTPLELAQKLA